MKRTGWVWHEESTPSPHRRRSSLRYRSGTTPSMRVVGHVDTEAGGLVYQRPPRHSACQAPLSQLIFRFKKVVDLYTSELPPMVPSPSRVPSSRDCRGTSVHAHTRSSSSFVPSSCAIVAARSSLCCVVGCRAKQTKQSKLVRSFVRSFVCLVVEFFDGIYNYVYGVSWSSRHADSA